MLYKQMQKLTHICLQATGTKTNITLHFSIIKTHLCFPYSLFCYTYFMLHYTKLNLTCKYVIRFLSTGGRDWFYRTMLDKSDFAGRCRLTSSVQNSIALVNHVLYCKEIKIIAFVLLHYWSKLMLEKIKNDVPVVFISN